MRTIRLLYAGLIGSALIQVVYFYPRLPEVVAAHFNAAGDPDRWDSKAVLFGLYAFTLALMLAIFALLPGALRRLPASMINLPNKDYWLSPERREQTFERLARQMGWFGVATIAMLVVVFQGVFSANIPGSAGFPDLVAGMALGAFLLFTVGWVAYLLLAYRLPRS